MTRGWLAWIVVAGMVPAALAAEPEKAKVVEKVTDVKIESTEAKRLVIVRRGEPTCTDVSITFKITGDEIKNAVGTGQVNVTETRSADGDELHVYKPPGRLFIHPQGEDEVVAVNNLPPVMPDPKIKSMLTSYGHLVKEDDGFRARLTIRNDETHAGTIASLKGSVKVMVPKKIESVAVEKVMEKGEKTLDDKRFADAGVTVTVEKVNADGLMLELHGKVWAVTDVRIKSATSKPDMRVFEQGFGDRAFIGMMGEMPEDAVLEVDVAVGAVEKVAPFELKDVDIVMPPAKGVAN